MEWEDCWPCHSHTLKDTLSLYYPELLLCGRRVWGEVWLCIQPRAFSGSAVRDWGSGLFIHAHLKQKFIQHTVKYVEAFCGTSVLIFPQLHSVSVLEWENSITCYAEMDNFRNKSPSGRGQFLILFDPPRAYLLKKNELMWRPAK